MSPMDEKTPEAPVADAETPTGDVTLESGAEGADLASKAPSPELTVPATETEAETPEPDAEKLTAPLPTAQAAPAEKEAEVRRYRPTDDYAVGDRIYHPIWDAQGVVTEREAQEQIFRIPVGKAEERGRCHLIRVEFETDVPASGGPRKDVLLIADWRGRGFEVGVPTAPALPEVETPEEAPAPVARVRRPALPEIPEPEEVLEEEVEAEGAVSEEDEDIEPIGI